MNALKFFKAFWSDKKNVASVIPTLRPGIKRICGKMDFSGRRVIVEYGPGTGVISREILRRMTPDSRIILIERNHELVPLLMDIKDSRATVFHDTAENAKEILERCGEEKADYVLSGIPFSRLPKEIVQSIVITTRDIIRDDGTFLVYQVRRKKADRYLGEVFSDVRKDFEFWNPPPLHIFEARGYKHVLGYTNAV